MPKSTYSLNAVLNALLRNTAYTSPVTVYVGLLNGATETTGGSYARQSITLGVPTAGICTSSTAQTFAGMPATTVANIGIYDALTAGNQLYNGTAAASKVTNAGDTVTIAVGGITVQES